MKRIFFNIVLFLFSLNSYYAYSQVNCNVPLPPELTLVSVRPETGLTEISWTLSPSTDIVAYILYTYKDGDGMAFDTIWNPLATSYSFNSSTTKYFSVSYVVAAYRLPVIPGLAGCPSQLSNVLNTIYATADIDTCNTKIVVSWNSYPSSPKKVTGYSIKVSVNGGSFTEASAVNPEQNNFTMNDFATDADYCFIVVANLEGGTFSTSNQACLVTKMQRPPGWINADYATVSNDRGISLSFTIDPLSEITRFILERKSGNSAIFSEISQPVSANGSVTYIDENADIKLINSYRLSAVNNCNNPVQVSNLCSNMVLSLERKENDLILSWNSYKNWMGLVSSYRVFVNTGKGFEEKAVLQPTDTLFTLGYKEIMYEVTGNEFCFYVGALETSNPYGITGESHSSSICTTPTEIITVPNIFTPGSGTINALFKPVLSFTPLDYHLVISDRQGKVLFESRDYSQAWDGTQNGNSLLQGVCLWFLKVTTPSGKSVSKTGTVTIINGR